MPLYLADFFYLLSTHCLIRFLEVICILFWRPWWNMSVSYTSNLVMARNVRKKLQVSNKMFKNPLKLYHAFPNKKNWLSDEYFSQIIDYMLFNDVNTLSSNFINYYLCLQNAMVAYGNVFCIILHPILFFSFLNFFYILWSRYNYFIIKKKNIKDTYLPLKSYKFPPKAVSWTLYYIYIYIHVIVAIGHILTKIMVIL